MSIKLDSELTFVAALFNKEVYDAVASLLDDFPWKTKAAQRIFEDRSVPLYEWSPESLFVILSNIMLPEEIQGIIDLIAGMSTPRSPAELKELVATIFSHYKRTRASDLIEKYNNDINKLILKIKEIPDDIATVTEVEPLGARKPSEVLESELGGLDRIIPSNFGVIQEATPFKGYLPGQVVMVCASPGCFTGDTEVLSLDSGKYYTMQELYESQEKDISVYSFDIENNRFEVSKGKYCQLTKETDDLVEVELEDGTVFRCTPDHKFLQSNNIYIEAQYLTDDSFVKEILDNLKEGSKRVKSVKRLKLDNPVPVYDIVDVDFYSNFAIRTKSNTGIIVHNSGKSAFMLYEVMLAAAAGFQVLWLALGDLIRFDFQCRFLSVLSTKSYAEVAVNPDRYFNDEARELANRIHLATVPANKLSTSEIVSLVNNGNVYYDVVVIDYDSNIRQNELLSSYEQGGELYKEITDIARPSTGNPRLVFVAAQPKQHFWNQELLPLEAAGESSRKQHTVDLMITMGKVDVNTSTHLAGIINLPKVRRGTPNLRTPYKMDNNGVFQELTYEQLAMVRRY